MNIEEQRKAFEEYYKKRHPEDKFTLLKSGNYSGWVKQSHWETWKASQNQEGFVLVPVEPTECMLEALSEHVNCFDGTAWLDSSEAYKSMIQEAQK